MQPVLVNGVGDQEVPAGVLLQDGEASPGGPTTAWLDTSQAAGRHLVSAEKLSDPRGLSSAGVAELLLRARELGADHLVVGVGALACHDGGLGLLRQLGVRADLSNLPQIRQSWQDVRMTLVANTDAPLLGFHGASAALGDLGVDARVTQRLETELGELTDRVNAVLPPARDLLTGLPRRPERESGAGAGGGVGYALQLLGAQTTTGPQYCWNELDIAAQLPASLLVLVTDSYDYMTVHDGVVAETARSALPFATPSVVLAREVSVGRREGMSLGISGSYEPLRGQSLEELGARVARTWTPSPPSSSSSS